MIQALRLTERRTADPLVFGLRYIPLCHSFRKDQKGVPTRRVEEGPSHLKRQAKFHYMVLGIVSLIGRIFTIERLFWKLDKMKAFWGDKRGAIIHFVGYTIVPIVVGTILILTQR
jgi:hypothetical protein